MLFAFKSTSRIALVLIAGLAVGCSKPKPNTNTPSVQPSSPAVVADTPRPVTPGPAPAVKGVDVPARRTDGARAMIGLNLENNEGGAISPNGQLLALAGGAGGVQLISVDTGAGVAWRQDLACIEPEPGFVGACQGFATFSTDGAHLWVYSRMQQKLRRLAVPMLSTEVEVAADGIFALQALSDGRVVGLRGKDSIVVDGSGRAQTFFQHQNSAIAVSLDGKQIALDDDNTARIYDVASHKAIAAAPQKGWPDKLRFLPDGKSWVAGFTDRNSRATVVTWRAGETTGRVLAASADTDKTPKGDVVTAWLLPPPFTHAWVTMYSYKSSEASLLRVSVDDGSRTTISNRGAATDLVERSDDIVLLSYACTERLDRKTGTRLPGTQLCAAGPDLVGFEGNDLLVQAGVQPINRFNSQTGAFVSEQLPVELMAMNAHTLAIVAHDSAVRQKVQAAIKAPNVKGSAYTVSNDGKWLFVGGRLDGQASIINLTTKQVRTVQGSVHPSGDGSIVLVGSNVAANPWKFDVRTVADDKLLSTITVDSLPLDVLVSDNGSLAAFSDGSAKTAVLDIKSGRRLAEFACSPAYYNQFEFSNDGAWLVCDTFAETQIIDIATKQILHRFGHPPDSAKAFSLSDDKRHFAVSSNTIRIYDL
jgi:WD40 repeat protein